MVDINIGMYVTWILAGVVAVGILVAILFFTKKGKGYTLKRAIATINEVFLEYGDKIRERDEVFYDELREALNTTNAVMEDEYISWGEKASIIKSYAKVFHRLFEIVKMRWSGSVMVIDTV